MVDVVVVVAVVVIVMVVKESCGRERERENEMCDDESGRDAVVVGGGSDEVQVDETENGCNTMWIQVDRTESHWIWNPILLYYYYYVRR